jgi:hypothetical protein
MSRLLAQVAAAWSHDHVPQGRPDREARNPEADGTPADVRRLKIVQRESSRMSTAIILVMGYEAFSTSLAVIAAAGMFLLGKNFTAE